MKWEAKKVKEGWGIFLMKKYCKTDKPVCYGVSVREDTAKRMVERLNNPMLTEATEKDN